MSLPFDCQYYDDVYTAVSTVLKDFYPIQPNENILSWHRRLLYSFLAYLQAKYDPVQSTPVVDASVKTNKKKDKPDNTNFTPANEPAFGSSVEKAMEIVFQDSDFAVYLLAWWLPLLLLDESQWIDLTLTMDNANTVAQSVQLKNICIRIQLTQLTIKTINDIPLSDAAMIILSSDAFVGSILSKLNQLVRNDTLSFADTLYDDQTNPTEMPFKIASYIWFIKEVTQSLFIETINIQTNINSAAVSVENITKSSEAKNSRKRFNARKLIQGNQLNTAEITISIIESLSVCLFRTYFDYDESSMPSELYAYMFLGADLVFSQ